MPNELAYKRMIIMGPFHDVEGKARQHSIVASGFIQPAIEGEPVGATCSVQMVFHASEILWTMLCTLQTDNEKFNNVM